MAYSRANGISPVLAELPSYEVCEFPGNAIVSGNSLILELTADAAPGFGMAHLIGKKAGVVWPVEYDEAENGRAKAVIDSLSGHAGGWYDVPTAAPVRRSSALTTPSQTAGVMADELTAACGPLGLIAPSGVCNSLRAKLNAAHQSIEHGNANAVNGQVSALLLELDAQRGEHVKEPAYIVLHALASLLQSQLAM